MRSLVVKLEGYLVNLLTRLPQPRGTSAWSRRAVCLHVSVPAWIYTRAYVHVFVPPSLPLHVSEYLHVCLHTSVNVCVCDSVCNPAFVSVSVCLYICACVLLGHCLVIACPYVMNALTYM